MKKMMNKMIENRLMAGFSLLIACLLLVGCERNALQTTSLSSEQVCYLTDAQEDSLTVSIHIEYPTAIGKTDALNNIQRDLKHRLFGEAYIDMEPQQALDAYVAMLKTEYKINNLPLKEDWEKDNRDFEYAPICCEEQVLTGSVMGEVKGILSYCVERYVYTGGAHGSNFRQFVNYNLQTGEQIDEEQLFAENYQEPLTQLLLQYMVEQNDEIALIQDLQEAGYNVDDIHPNDNFYLAEEGITYVFNPYDIAPYALGETEILIPWSALQNILKPEFQTVEKQ